MKETETPDGPVLTGVERPIRINRLRVPEALCRAPPGVRTRIDR